MDELQKILKEKLLQQFLAIKKWDEGTFVSYLQNFGVDAPKPPVIITNRWHSMRLWWKTRINTNDDFILD